MEYEVTPIQGETGRYHVEGRSLVCNLDCGYSWSPRRKLRRFAGEHCPKCGDGFLEPRLHLVDIVPFNANGECSCEWFEKHLAPQLRRMTKQQRLTVRIRCPHIQAARDFELDREIFRFDNERKKHHGKQPRFNDPDND